MARAEPARRLTRGIGGWVGKLEGTTGKIVQASVYEVNAELTGAEFSEGVSAWVARVTGEDVVERIGESMRPATYHASHDPASGEPKPSDGCPVHEGRRPDFVRLAPARPEATPPSPARSAAGAVRVERCTPPGPESIVSATRSVVPTTGEASAAGRMLTNGRNGAKRVWS